jgi:hypothetical protein
MEIIKIIILLENDQRDINTRARTRAYTHPHIYNKKESI